MSLAQPQQLLARHAKMSAHVLDVHAASTLPRRHFRTHVCQSPVAQHVHQHVHQHVSSSAVLTLPSAWHKQHTVQQQQCTCLPGHSDTHGMVDHKQQQNIMNRRVSSRRTALAASSTTAATATDQAPSISSNSSSNSAAPEMCVIVDEHNNVVGAATRYETVAQRLLGRGSYVLVFNSAGQLFVSQRSKSKDCYPGRLDVTISGVVNQGEEYIDTAVRELQEEIDIPLEAARQQLQQLFVFPYQDSVCHVWGCALSMTWDGPVAFKDAEVEWGRFMDVRELQQQLQQSPDEFTPVGRHILDLYFEHTRKQQVAAAGQRDA